MTDRGLAGCALLPCPFCGGRATKDPDAEWVRCLRAISGLRQWMTGSLRGDRIAARHFRNLRHGSSLRVRMTRTMKYLGSRYDAALRKRA